MTCEKMDKCQEGEDICKKMFEFERSCFKPFAETVELDDDISALSKLCKELLDGANKCGQPPHFIVQPFLGIVKRNAKIINKYNLID